MRNLMAMLLVVVLPFGAACSGKKGTAADEAAKAAEPEKAAEPAELTVDQVAARLKEAKFYVFDNNDTETFKTGHVPGAKWLDYKHVTAQDLPADKDATLVFYCANEH